MAARPPYIPHGEQAEIMAKLSALRRLPSAVGLSAAGSLYFSAPSGVPTTVGGYILIAGLAAWLLSLFPFAASRAWVLRATAGVAAGTAVGFFVAARPAWVSVLAALVPIAISAIFFGAPFSADGGPEWQRGPSLKPRPPARMALAVDAYIVITEAVMYQFLADDSARLLTISVLLSAVGVGALGMVAAGGPRTVRDTRTALRIIGLVAQVHLSGHAADLPAIRVAAGVVSGIYSIPATL
jgi:hypothetical protein